MRKYLLCLWLAPATVLALPASAPHPGGIAVVKLGAADTRPRVRFSERPVLLIRENGRWHAVVGIPLDQPAGNATLQVDGEAKSIAVLPHDYREQHLTVKPSYVNPDPAAMQRIAEEQQRIRAAIAQFSDVEMARVELQAAPVPGSRSDSFGSRRFFNNEPRSPHRGMDLSGADGTDVVAALGGTVQLADDFYFTGNAVFIDHGQGLVSLYAHLSRIDVAAGDRVAAGEIIGAVGATGRVTGPHLHFATYLNGTPVDPALLLPPAD